MKSSSAVIFLLISAAMGGQLDEASCAHASVKSDRSLIQYQKASATPLQVAEGAGNEKTKDRVKITELFAEVLAQAETQEEQEEENIGAAQLFSQALKEKEDWTGNVIDVEFAKTSADMKSVLSIPYSDYAGVNLSGNVSKTFLQMSIVQTEGSQIVSNATKDKILVFGFEPSTSGIKNVNANRIWTGKPGKGKSMLVYGIIMTGAEGPSEWNYNIEFLQPPPQIKFKIFPPDGKVGKHDGNLFVAMTCDEPEDETECDDGNVVVSAVQFTRADKKPIKQPEEVQAMPEAAL